MRRLCTSMIFSLIFLLVACVNSDGRINYANNTSHSGSKKSGIACPTSTNTTPQPPERKPITLTVAGWSSTPSENLLVRKELAAFQATHPNISLKWMPLTGNYPDMMKADILNGNAPDVFYLQPDMTS